MSHWRLFQFCQAYTRTIQKNGESHWSCMVANERSGNQLCQPNWQDLPTKFILFAASRLVAGKTGEEAHEHGGGILSPPRGNWGNYPKEHTRCIFKWFTLQFNIIYDTGAFNIYQRLNLCVPCVVCNSNSKNIFFLKLRRLLHSTYRTVQVY